MENRVKPTHFHNRILFLKCYFGLSLCHCWQRKKCPDTFAHPGSQMSVKGISALDWLCVPDPGPSQGLTCLCVTNSLRRWLFIVSDKMDWCEGGGGGQHSRRRTMEQKGSDKRQDIRTQLCIGPLTRCCCCCYATWQLPATPHLHTANYSGTAWRRRQKQSKTALIIDVWRENTQTKATPAKAVHWKSQGGKIFILHIDLIAVRI